MDKKTIEIDLLDDLEQLWKKFWVLALCGIAGALVAFAVTWFVITPKYQSSASLYVNNKNQTINNTTQAYSTGDIAAAKSLVDTYIVILEKRPTLEAVIENCNLPYNYEQLKGMVSAKAENETEIFSVTVTSTDPIEAQAIVNAIANVLPAEIAKVVEGASVQIVEWGNLNPVPVSPSYKKNLLIGFLLGVIVAIALVLIKYYSDNKIHDENFVTKMPGEHPLLAVIPDLMENGGKRKKGYGYGYGYDDARNNVRSERLIAVVQEEAKLLCEKLGFHAAESYKLLRTNILYTLTDKEDGCMVFGLTSSMRGEGKSTTSINLAYTFAETGKRVLLIEADMRIPVIANRLHLNVKPGLSNILGGFSGIKEVLQPSNIKGNWYIIVAGYVPPNPAELLESKQMEKVLDLCRNSLDYIIIDLPPVNVVADALAVSPYLDGLVMISREEYTDMPSLYDAVQRIEFSQGNLLGYVLTDSASSQKIKYRSVGFNLRKRGYGYGYDRSKSK